MQTTNKHYDIIIIGAGASGLFCAMHCAENKNVLLIEKNNLAGKKLAITGGGACNFSNEDITANNYFSHNPHFVKSALAKFSTSDICEYYTENNLHYETRDQGKLFGSKLGAQRLTDSLLKNYLALGGHTLFSAAVTRIKKIAPNENSAHLENSTHVGNSGNKNFLIETEKGSFSAENLVLALGSPAWQKNADPLFNYCAKEFTLATYPFSPALSPLFATHNDLNLCINTTGNALTVRLLVDSKEIVDQLLFTHTGLSGPAALRASLWWKKDTPIIIDFLPTDTISDVFEENKQEKILIKTLLGYKLPKKMLPFLFTEKILLTPCNALQKKTRELIAETIHAYSFIPAKIAPLQKAETTIGGFDTQNFSSKNMQATHTPNLFAIGECLDVAGDLGGYNLHWAFASAFAAAMHLK